MEYPKDQKRQLNKGIKKLNNTLRNKIVLRSELNFNTLSVNILKVIAKNFITEANRIKYFDRNLTKEMHNSHSNDNTLLLKEIKEELKNKGRPYELISIFIIIEMVAIGTV